MNLTRRMMRWLVDFYREMDLGLAVMRGEEKVARNTAGIDWSRKIGKGSTLGCRCCRGRSAR